MNKFLFNTDGSFNWLAATAIVAILTFAWNVWFSSKKYKADLIAKNRAEWIDTVRPLVAHFIAIVSNYMYNYQVFAVKFAYEPNCLDRKTRQKEKQKFDEAKKQSNSNLTEMMKDIRNTYYQLVLLGIVNDKTVLSHKINLLWHELDYIVPYYDKGVRAGKFNRYPQTSYDFVIDQYLSKLMNEIVFEGEKYFTEEWHRVKKGE